MEPPSREVARTPYAAGRGGLATPGDSTPHGPLMSMGRKPLSGPRHPPHMAADVGQHEVVRAEREQPPRVVDSGPIRARDDMADAFAGRGRAPLEDLRVI